MTLLISRQARERYAVGERRFGARGKIALADFTSARHLAHSLSGGDSEAPAAGDLVALALLNDLHRLMLRYYEGRYEPLLFARLAASLEEELGGPAWADVLSRFGEAFELTDRPASSEGLKESARLADQQSLVFDLVLCWLQRSNPAAAGLVEKLHRGFVVDDAMQRAFAVLGRFLAACPGLDGGEDLGAQLLAPLRYSPGSIAGQLAYMRERWPDVFGTELARLQGVLDLIAEEQAPRWPAGSGPPAAPVPGSAWDDDVERYSSDRDWMPELVLVAKNILVWLDQLSRRYGRQITRLDQIPEEELATIAERGFTGLWLIGVWERSEASANIKKLRGNPEAAASAYSLRGYRIAEELGGEEALEELKRRARRHGVRLAADMVPNHMGIDSDWVLDHPEWFVSVDESPFPAYRFEGLDLAPVADVEVKIEDHYYDATDAAVVFRHGDRAGKTRFIYHGNDGTSTPWNDTAQLNYLNPKVREAVLETIVDVARRFSIIRFDAAMTLTKRHYQRLWHPRPGTAGAIPSRAEHGMSEEEFHRRMPEEFWRQVVERVTAEVPDTLLLAEAFWLMEGYFVRTLGLHRVYNSAFMHMLRDQETGKFRRLLKETLAFDPQILCRYVNFMSNPDEEPAVAQFERGDRYFGVCTVLSTLPGLPMFAHGQWEGLEEKYGMEYRRAYRDEQTDELLMARHGREIAPLLRDRRRYAGVDSFRLYDLVGEGGTVNDAVLAYSNGDSGACRLVVFNNSPGKVRGWLHASAPFRPDGAAAGDLHTETLGERMRADGDRPLCAFCDAVHQMQYLQRREVYEGRGLQLQLGPFQSVVIDRVEGWHDDAEGTYSTLADNLGGAGVDDLQRVVLKQRAEPLARLLRRTVTAEPDGSESKWEEAFAELPAVVEHWLAGPPWHDPHAAAAVAREIDDVVQRRLRHRAAPLSAESPQALHDLVAELDDQLATNGALRLAGVLLPLVRLVQETAGEAVPASRLLRMLAEGAGIAEISVDLLEFAHVSNWGRDAEPPASSDLAAIAEHWCRHPLGQKVLAVHEADDEEWLVREPLEELLRWRLLMVRQAAAARAGLGDEVFAALVGWELALSRMAAAAQQAGYRSRRWVELLAETRRSRKPESPTAQASGPESVKA